MLDFMSTIMPMSLEKIPNMGAAIYASITSAWSLSQVSDFIHIVLDSYIEMSLNEGRGGGGGRTRFTEPTICINIMCMTRDTPIPQQLDKFRVSPGKGLISSC